MSAETERVKNNRKMWCAVINTYIKKTDIEITENIEKVVIILKDNT